MAIQLQLHHVAKHDPAPPRAFSVKTLSHPLRHEKGCLSGLSYNLE